MTKTGAYWAVVLNWKQFPELVLFYGGQKIVAYLMVGGVSCDLERRTVLINTFFWYGFC